MTNMLFMLAAIAAIETGCPFDTKFDKPYKYDLKVGKAGEVSRYQIKTKDAKFKKLLKEDPSYAINRAAELLHTRVSEYIKKFGRCPSVFQIYCLWNAPNQVMQNKVSARVKERALRFYNLLVYMTPVDQAIIWKAHYER